MINVLSTLWVLEYIKLISQLEEGYFYGYEEPISEHENIVIVFA